MMARVSLLRDVIRLIIDLYDCDAVKWSCFNECIFTYSLTCGAVAVAYANTLSYHSQPCRRNLGKLLRKSVNNFSLDHMEEMRSHPTIYVIFSLWHHHRYIGSTINFGRRMGDHYRAALRCTKENSVSARREVGKVARVHKCMRLLGVEEFGMLPICTSDPDILREVESSLIRRLQPTLNIVGTYHGRLQRVTTNNIRCDTTRRTTITHPGRIASRLRTAYRHVMLQTLGTALPPELGSILLQAMRSNSRSIAMDMKQRHGPYRIFPHNGMKMLQMEFGEENTRESQATLTTFRIATCFGETVTSDIRKCWPNLLLNCPTTDLLYGFCAVRCRITVEHRGTLGVRKTHNIQQVIWAPITISVLSSGNVITESLRSALRGLEDDRVVQVNTGFTSLAIRGNVNNILVLYDVGKHPGRVNWLLRTYSMSDVLIFWRTCAAIRSRQWRKSVRGTISQYMTRMWKFNPCRHPTICIEGTPLPGFRNHIRRLTTSIVFDMPVERDFMTMFLEKMRIVSVSARSIASVLVSNIQFAQSFTEIPPVCTCNQLRQVLGIHDIDDDSHIGMRGKDVAESAAHHIFSINAMSILHPSSIRYETILVKAICSIYSTFGKWVGQRLQEKYDSFEEAISLAAGLAALPSWCVTDHIASIIQAARKVGTPPRVGIWSDIRDVVDKLQPRYSRGNGKSMIPSGADLEALHERLRHICVISSLDRNSGELYVECPERHYDLLKTSFLGENNSNYLRVHDMTKEDIVSEWERLGDKAAIPGTFSKQGELPYCYVNRKDKDCERARPIVSFAAAPHRIQLKYCARAFFFIILVLHVQHFTLWSTLQVRARVFEATKALIEETNDNNSQIIATTSDIKDMYTNLCHDDIMAAVSWGLNVFKTQTRRDRVNVNRRGPPTGQKGRVYDNAARVEVRCSSIGHYVEMMLRTCYFRCGEVIMRQTIGIPMGSHISPPLAIVVCMYCEYKYIASYNNVPPPIRGFRYMDDILHITMYEDELFLDQARDIYPKTLRVIVTGYSRSAGTTVPFLETDISWVGSTLLMEHNNKNSKVIGETGRQKIARFRHGKSFVPQPSLRAVVVCMLSRCIKFATTLSSQLVAVFDLITEFRSLCYPMGLIRQAVYRLLRMDEGHAAFWSLITAILQRFSTL